MTSQLSVATSNQNERISTTEDDVVSLDERVGNLEPGGDGNNTGTDSRGLAVLKTL